MSLAFGAGAKDGPGWYRCVLPAKWLREHGVDARVVYDQVGERELAGVDRFLFQRTHAASSYASMQQMKQRGWRLLYELDDNIWRMPEWNPLRVHFPQAVRERMERILIACDAVVTTTNKLAEVLYRLNRNVEVIPNGIDLSLFPDPVRREKRGVRVGWTGSFTHTGDVAVAMSALKRMLELRPEVTLVFMGWVPKEFAAHPRVEFHPWVAPELYYAALAALELDVGIAPLLSCQFNDCKSPVKLLEYAALGIPVVASDVGPYRCVENGEIGFRVKDNRGDLWLSMLMQLIQRPDERERMGQAARDWLKRGHTMDQRGPEWASAFLVELPALASI